jgi:hypothetical protein
MSNSLGKSRHVANMSTRTVYAMPRADTLPAFEGSSSVGSKSGGISVSMSTQSLRNLFKRVWDDEECVLTNGGTEAQEPAVCTARSRLQLGCTLTPAACTARSARSVPGQDTRSGQGALARRHTDGPLWAALLKTTVMCEAWRRHTVAAPNPSRTADRPKPNSPYNWVLDTDTGTGPIPSITVSKVNAYSGGILARALPEGLRYLST